MRARMSCFLTTLAPLTACAAHAPEGVSLSSYSVGIDVVCDRGNPELEIVLANVSGSHKQVHFYQLPWAHGEKGARISVSYEGRQVDVSRMTVPDADAQIELKPGAHVVGTVQLADALRALGVVEANGLAATVRMAYRHPDYGFASKRTMTVKGVPLDCRRQT